LFNAKKVNKALLMELEKYKSHMVSQDGAALRLGYTHPLALEDESKFRSTTLKN